MIFHEVKAVYERQSGEDNPAKVKETYLVEAVNCADAEKQVMDEIKPFVFGDSEVTACQKRQFFEIINAPEGDKWYKGRVELITIEDSGKETRKAVSLLVQADSAAMALKNLSNAMNGYDCEILSIAKSPVLDILRTEKGE